MDFLELAPLVTLSAGIHSLPHAISGIRRSLFSTETEEGKVFSLQESYIFFCRTRRVLVSSGGGWCGYLPWNEGRRLSLYFLLATLVIKLS
jgi:hypothetical protein